MTREGLDARLPNMDAQVQNVLAAPNTLQRQLLGIAGRIVPPLRARWERAYEQDSQAMQEVAAQIAQEMGLTGLEQAFFTESFSRHIAYHTLYGVQKRENSVNPVGGSRVRRVVNDVYAHVDNVLPEAYSNHALWIAAKYPISQNQVIGWFGQIDAAASHIAFMFAPDPEGNKKPIPTAEQIDTRLEQLRNARQELHLSEADLHNIDERYFIKRAQVNKDIVGLSRALSISVEEAQRKIDEANEEDNELERRVAELEDIFTRATELLEKLKDSEE